MCEEKLLISERRGVARGFTVLLFYIVTNSVTMKKRNKKNYPRTLGDERGSRFVYKNKNRYRMERNLRV